MSEEIWTEIEKITSFRTATGSMYSTARQAGLVQLDVDLKNFLKEFVNEFTSSVHTDEEVVDQLFTNKNALSKILGEYTTRRRCLESG